MKRCPSAPSGQDAFAFPARVWNRRCGVPWRVSSANRRRERIGVYTLCSKRINVASRHANARLSRKARSCMRAASTLLANNSRKAHYFEPVPTQVAVEHRFSDTGLCIPLPTREHRPAGEYAAHGFASRACGWAISYEDCMRMSVSIFTPKAFSMRSAISPERSALPLAGWKMRAGKREALPPPP